MTPGRCVLQVAPVLPQDVRHQARALSDAGMLHTLVSSLAYSERGAVERCLGFLDRTLGTDLLSRTERRRLEAGTARAVACRPWAEVWARAGARLGLLDQGAPTNDRYFAATDRLARRFVDDSVRLVVAREDACVHAFRAARPHAALRLYDLPTAHYETVRAIMERETAEFPGAAAESSRRGEYRTERNRRKNEELAAADHVLVASEFVRQSLLAGQRVSGDRITVVPYGCQTVSDVDVSAHARSNVLLFVGNVSVRKGVPRLLRAWKRLGAAASHRLVLIGPMQLTSSFLADYRSCFEHRPRLPRSELGEYYRSARALVLPSAADGFGLVICEALAHALPVIASTHSGGPGFLGHGREGLLYPFGDDDSLAASLERILSRPQEVEAMAYAARELAQRRTWKHYREDFVRLVHRLLSEVEA